MKIVKFIKDKALSASIAAYQLRGTVAKSLVVLPLALLSKEAAAETTIWERSIPSRKVWPVPTLV